MARKADDYIDDMIYVWKGNCISFPMTYHVSLYLLCVQSYRQKSDVGALTFLKMAASGQENENFGCPNAQFSLLMFQIWCISQ